jgi:hypothetical protein
MKGVQEDEQSVTKDGSTNSQRLVKFRNKRWSEASVTTTTMANVVNVGGTTSTVQATQNDLSKTQRYDKAKSRLNSSKKR